LEELIREKQWDVLRDALSHFHPSDIAEILVDSPEEDDAPLFRILPRELAGRVFAYLPTHHQEALIRSVSNDQMRQLLKEMSPDDQTRLLEELPPEVTKRILETLSPEELKSARELVLMREAGKLGAAQIFFSRTIGRTNMSIADMYKTK
jgi:magnesium transporter